MCLAVWLQLLLYFCHVCAVFTFAKNITHASLAHVYMNRFNDMKIKWLLCVRKTIDVEPNVLIEYVVKGPVFIGPDRVCKYLCIHQLFN